MKSGWIKKGLFALTMGLLFVFVVQEQTRLFTFRPLKGVYEPSPKPELTFENLTTAQYQSDFEPYFREHFGFREPLIRFYNQYLYDVFRTSSNAYITVGKDHWLYHAHNVTDYLGIEPYYWYATPEKAYATYDREVLRMWKLRSLLKDYGVDFLVFMAPEKGFVYPEHLPDRRTAIPPIRTTAYYASKFNDYGIPHIEMTQWFINLKKTDTLPYSLFPQTGVHWCFSSVLATDSLMRLMGDLKGINLPKLQIGPLHESNAMTLADDHDLELMLNLRRPLPHHDDRLLDAEVTYLTDSTASQPSAIFIGTSFLRRMYYYVPLSQIFPKSQYWYYNSTVYYGNNYSKSTKVEQLDLLSELLETDYVVWFTEGEQMYKASFDFVENALVNLCVDDERREAVYQRVMDSLGNGPDAREDALHLVFKNPEYYFPELAGDSLPATRNPRIAEVLVGKDIKNDPDWMVKLRCQATYQNLPLKDILRQEEQNILNHNVLIRDTMKTVTLEAYAKSFVDDMVNEINSNPEMVSMIQEKAINNNRSYEEQVYADARWIVDYNIETGVYYWKDPVDKASK